MNNDIGQQNNPRNNKAIAGIILLAIGGILLLQQFVLPEFWHAIKLWPLWLVFIGAYIGSRCNFQKPSSYILMGLGVFFLIEQNIHGSANILWPVAIIGFGLWMILRRQNTFDSGKWNNKYNDYSNPNQPSPNEPIVDYTTSADGSTNSGNPNPSSSGQYKPTGDEYLDAVSVFGGVKKTILSKDFKGGEIVNLFGGAQIDLTQADINGRVVIDITQIFGGTKIIVPPHWQVVSDIAAVFAGVDDKRMKMNAAVNSDKILVLKGVSIFAGVDIRSF